MKRGRASLPRWPLRAAAALQAVVAVGQAWGGDVWGAIGSVVLGLVAWALAGASIEVDWLADE